MEYFGVELFEGKSFGGTPCYLDENLPMEEQWVHLSLDIGYIQYFFEEIELSISISYSHNSGPILDPNAVFIVEVNFTNDEEQCLDLLKILFCKDLKGLKEAIKEAVNFIMGLKHFDKNSIQKLRLPDNINHYENYIRKNISNCDYLDTQALIN